MTETIIWTVSVLTALGLLLSLVLFWVARKFREIHKLLFSLRDTLGQTLVIVTHDPELAAICDRSIAMKDGRFI